MIAQKRREKKKYLVDQVAGSGGLAGVDVADNDEVDVSLFFALTSEWINEWAHAQK